MGQVHSPTYEINETGLVGCSDKIQEAALSLKVNNLRCQYAQKAQISIFRFVLNGVSYGPKGSSPIKKR